jgi:3-deoxy-7-phosphoheptulonate synthase
MHGNTPRVAHRLQDAALRRVVDEVLGFFDVTGRWAPWPGGIHVELTGEDVTECLGGAMEISDATSTAGTRAPATRG